MDRNQLTAIIAAVDPDHAETISGVLSDVLPLRDMLPEKRLAERRTVWVMVGITDMPVDVEVGFYPDGRPGEVFLSCGKEGDAIRDMFDGIAILLSISLQHGVTLKSFPVRGRGNELTGEGNALLDTIFATVEELCKETPCITPRPTTSPIASVSSTSNTAPPSTSG